MTPDERKQVSELFDRLQSLENAPRDPDAVAAINDGLGRAPNALYPLVQTTLLQDEVLKQAHARIRDLEAQLGIAQPQQDGFLDGMRETMSRKRETHGSVPLIRPDAPSGPWRTTSLPQSQPSVPPAGNMQDQPAPGSGGSSGSSFLGTAAATAAGVVGGALLMNSLRGMFGNQGGGQGRSQSAFDSGTGGQSPWNSGASSGDLARDAGIDDISSSKRSGAGGRDSSERAGLFDSTQSDAQDGDWTGADNDDFDDSDSDSDDSE